MSAGLHRFLVSWVSLFFMSDDRLHSICARVLRTSYGPGRSASSARPPSIGVLSFPSPREQPDAQALLAAGICPLGQTGAAISNHPVVSYHCLLAPVPRAPQVQPDLLRIVRIEF